MENSVEEQVAAVPAGEAPPSCREYAFTFTGSGSEYFRIWIVNLALTVATLGIYSAWAKVRRMQYFYRNTLLDNYAFNFHADPKAILRGRLLAVGIVVLYHYAFGFSMEVGIAVVLSLIFGLPFLMMNALRFRLRNTSYRGLRFGFNGKTGGAYLGYAPIVALLVIPGALAAIPETAEFVALSMLAYIAWPSMYGAMKRYQHANLRYAQCQSAYEADTSEIYFTYLKSLGMMLLAIVPAVLLTMGAVMFAESREEAGSLGAKFLPIFIGLFMTYVMYLVTLPYIAVRIANLVWNGTRLGGIEFDSRLKARKLMRLQTRNTILTLLTLGLYRPFAVVSVHRFRVEHILLRSELPLSAVVAGALAKAPSAAGDGAVDLFGFDLSW